MGRARITGGARIVLGRGPRAVEAELLARVSELAGAARARPELLALPVRVIVPSRSLRLHVCTRVAARLGPTAGLVVQTLHGVAAEILEHAGEEPAASDDWVDLLARRAARGEPALAEALDGFEDGFRAPAASIRDLIDSGLEPELAEPLRECLAELRVAPAVRRRAQALVSAAIRVAADIERAGAGGRGALLHRAHLALASAPGLLPARATIVHGFADATGRAAELLETLLACAADGCILLDEPEEVAAGERFGARLRARLSGRFGEPAAAPDAPEPSVHALFRASGPEAEVRAVAERLRAELARGTAPEALAVVARDLGPYRTLLRRHLGRLGVPFSALRTRAPLDGAGRRMLALLELLESSGELAADRWLDAVAALRVEREPEEDADGSRSSAPIEKPPSAELRLALRVLGAARLADVADLAPELDERGRLPLPLRTGSFRADAAPGGASEATREHRDAPGFQLARRKLAGAELRAARAAARRVHVRLARWPATATLAEHFQRLARLLRTDLGWRAADTAQRRVRAALEGLADFPGWRGAPIARDELVRLLRRALAGAAAPELGGRGGGVQVLDVMEARGRTFERIFVIGLVRDAFPRVVREDPLLPDDVRRALESVLPDVPIKARGRAEDRHLFAQLCAAAPHVSLSWPLCDEDGKRKVVSPLVERLLEGRAEDEVETVPGLHDAGASDDDRARTAAESAIRAGLAGARAHRAEILRLCLEEADGRGAADQHSGIAASRARVLSAYERGPREPLALAPWLGFLGAEERVGARSDLAASPPYVTLVEALAKCPWQAVLTKVLRLEQGFEALDGAGRIDPRAVGNVVHQVLEALARRELGEAGAERADLASVLSRAPAPLSWPEPRELDALVADVARRAFLPARASEARVRWLAERARPHLETARELLSREAELGGGVLGVEVEGRVKVGAAPRGPFEVAFRADRVEKVGEELVLTDFKTGQPEKRDKLRKELIPRGTHLQPIAYVLAARETAPDVRGRYLHLVRELEDVELDVGVGARHTTSEADLVAVLEAVFAAWRTGAFFPRIYDDHRDREPEACRLCAVSQACLRGDSGARLALAKLLEADEGAELPGPEWRAAWDLAHASREEAR